MATKDRLTGPHLKITEHRGFHMVFKNGWTASVQFGPGHYADHYNAFDEVEAPHRTERWASTTAEVAGWDAEGRWLHFEDGDTVKGYCSPDEILEFLNRIAAQPRSRNG